ncbi:MAG: ATP-binding protein [Pseudohongiellaceae bacterium]
MQFLFNHFSFLWNGGLEPSSTDLVSLRERRILAGIVFLILPVGTLIIFGNFSSGASADNWFLYFGLCLLVGSLYVQAYENSQRTAGNLVFFTYWIMPTLLMQRYGVQGTTMMWLLPVSPLAVLVLGRRTGGLWAGLCCLTFVFYGTLHSQGLIRFVTINHEYVPHVGKSNAIEMVLLTLILTGSAIIFRQTQRMAESKLRTLVRKLTKEVRSRRLAEKDAKHSEQTKTDFLSSMSHEIRTPLNGVIAATRLMIEAETDSERKEYANIVLLSSDTLLELVSDIMDLDAMSSGKLTLASDIIASRELVQSSLWPLQFQAKEKGINFNIHIDPEFPEFVMGDRVRAKQILLNLVGNAIKFTQRGSVDFSLAVDHEMIVIQVKDSGIGIDKKAQMKLFEPFVQADNSTRSNFGGSGLGLTIVKKIINTMKGKIELESTVGEGSKFSVYLPLLIPTKPSVDEYQKAKNEQRPQADLRPLNILIADDNAVNRMVLERLLEKDKHKVVSVDDGKKALDYLEAHDVDILLLDLQMPIMSGEEAAAAIRKLPGTKSSAPIIAITANVNADNSNALLGKNFDGFVAKPFKHDELVEEINLHAK